MADPPQLSCIVVNWNTRDLLTTCLESIRTTMADIPHEIWVVDNASTDNSADMVREHFPNVHLITNTTNRGFAAANNQALSRMNGRYALLLNSDAALTESAARILLNFMDRTPEAGMACGQLLNPDGSRQNSIANFPSLISLLTNESLLQLLMPGKYPNKRVDYRHPIEIPSGIGACLIVRKEAMDQVGLLDEAYFFFFEETDWAKRMWVRGWKVFFVPEARIFHAQGKSVGPQADGRILFYRSRYIYLRKWHPFARYPMAVAIVIRLIANLTFTGLATVLTLGFVNSLRNRTRVYGALLRWHLTGCP